MIAAHLVLVGASILTNAQRAGIVEGSLPDLEAGLKGGRVDEGELTGRLVEFVSGDPKGASAELSTLLDLLEEWYERGLQQWVYLLFSDTRIGRVCAETLRNYLMNVSGERYGGRVAVEMVRVEGLGDPERFEDGLARLFSTITEIIRARKGEGDRVFVHATGGFKPETAMAILAANSPGTGAPVFYVHEHFKRVVRIPAMPVRFRKWGKLTELIGSLVDIGPAARDALEGRYGKDAVRQAVRLGWAEEKEERVYPTETAKVLWRQTEEVWRQKKQESKKPDAS